MFHIGITKEPLLYQALALFFNIFVQLNGQWYSYRFSRLWKTRL